VKALFVKKEKKSKEDGKNLNFFFNLE